jgi:hypothetical protein
LFQRRNVLKHLLDLTDPVIDLLHPLSSGHVGDMVDLIGDDLKGLSNKVCCRCCVLVWGLL